MVGSPPDLPTPGESTTRALIPAEDDGLGAFAIAAGPHARFGGVNLSPGSPGQYYCITRGSLLHEHEHWGPGALAWRGAHDDLPTLHAGESRCEIVVVQFPHPTAPYFDDEYESPPAPGQTLTLRRRQTRNGIFT